MATQTPTQIQAAVFEILDDMTQDWDLDVEEFKPEMKLAKDLNFSSVDIIQFVVSTEECFGRKLGFDVLLMKDGRYVDDISLEQWISFTTNKLNGG